MITDARKKDLAKIADALEMIINHIDGGMDALGEACGLSVSEYSQVEDAIFDNGVFYERVEGDLGRCMDTISHTLTRPIGYERDIWLALYTCFELDFFYDTAVDHGLKKEVL